MNLQGSWLFGTIENLGFNFGSTIEINVFVVVLTLILVLWGFSQVVSFFLAYLYDRRQVSNTGYSVQRSRRRLLKVKRQMCRRLVVLVIILGGSWHFMSRDSGELRELTNVKLSKEEIREGLESIAKTVSANVKKVDVAKAQESASSSIEALKQELERQAKILESLKSKGNQESEEDDGRFVDARNIDESIVLVSDRERATDDARVASSGPSRLQSMDGWNSSSLQNNEEVVKLAPISTQAQELNNEFVPSKPIVPYPSSEEGETPVEIQRVPIRDSAKVALIENSWRNQNSIVQTSGELERSERSILELIDDESNRISSLVRACVLPIETRKQSNTSSQGYEDETGCGMLLQYRDRLFVITNNHVVRNALSRDNIKIFLPKEKVVAPKKVYSCPDFDLAALEVDYDLIPSDGSVTLCRFGNSDEARVANSVFAIGNPFGLEKSLSYGHISSLRRTNKDLAGSSSNALPEYIQIDAAINPGNSGGPLYNARGEVIGVVTAIATTSGKNEGVAFAIPINIALSVIKSTIDDGEWRRSRLGVELEAKSASLAGGFPYSHGAKIIDVQTNSPAAEAGFRAQDVVMEFDGRVVEDDAHLARMIALADASKTSVLSVVRDGKIIDLRTKFVRVSSPQK